MNIAVTFTFRNLSCFKNWHDICRLSMIHLFGKGRLSCCHNRIWYRNKWSSSMFSVWCFQILFWEENTYFSRFLMSPHKTKTHLYNRISRMSLFFNIFIFTIYNNAFVIYIPSFWNHNNTTHTVLLHFHRTLGLHRMKNVFMHVFISFNLFRIRFRHVISGPLTNQLLLGTSPV